MKRLIFLDFDGVLNSIASSMVNRTWMTFDKISVGLVHRLCAETEARIIVSSTWRIGKTMETMADTMRRAGADILVPYVMGMTRWHDSRDSFRGDEIKAKLQDLQWTRPYVILDDDSDMLDEQKPHFVQTCVAEGFRFGDYVKALEILMPHHPEIKNLSPYVDRRVGQRSMAGHY